ncbi:MAG: hypothetical protein HY823_04440 [Acidobacteria bacterium]|nr:hypothetical protein [Acidobacteriota bacterium]
MAWNLLVNQPRAWVAALGLGGLGLLAQAGPVAPRLLRDRKPAERPALLVLGTVHLDNPGRDVVNTRIDDVRSPSRQAQLAEIINRLAAFRPTRIAVEWDRLEQARLDARYRDYREGRYSLGRSEVDQIGLRLAARLGLPRLEAVDWNEMPPGKEEDFDWMAWAESRGDLGRVQALRSPSRGDSPEREDLLAWLRHANAPAVMETSHRQYFDYLLLGDDKAYPGANWVGNWFTRNLKIFTHLLRLTGDPKERILVVYGAGHAPLLRQFSEQSGAFRLEDPLKWLSP